MHHQSEPPIVKDCKFCHGSIDGEEERSTTGDRLANLSQPSVTVERSTLPVDWDCHEETVTISEMAMAKALGDCHECPYGNMCVPEGCKF